MELYEQLYEQLYEKATLGSCTFRKYAAAIVSQKETIGIGYARTVDGNICRECKRLAKIQEYGEISEFFEDCNVIHAEICAILDCKNKEKLIDADIYLLGICSDGISIYKEAFPCPNCLKVIQYVGINTVNVFWDKDTIKRYEV